MSELVQTPKSVTDPYEPEQTNTAPVRVRLLHVDKTTTDRLEYVGATQNVLAMPLFFCGGRLYVRRGTDGVRHLFREVPEIPRLDATPTVGEVAAYRAGLAAALELAKTAQASVQTSRTTSEKRALGLLIGELETWMAGP